MKKLLPFYTLTLLAISNTAHATQAMDIDSFSEKDMQSLQAMSKCMEDLDKQGAFKAFDKYQPENKKVQSLCKQNKRDEAQKLFNASKKQYDKEPVMAQIKKCSELASPKFRAITEQSKAKFEKMHACDISDLNSYFKQ